MEQINHEYTHSRKVPVHFFLSLLQVARDPSQGKREEDLSIYDSKKESVKLII